MIADGERFDSGADFDHNARAFVPQNGGEKPLRIRARQSVGVGVAHAGGFDFDHDFARARAFDIDLFDCERRARLARHGGDGFHFWFSPVCGFRVRRRRQAVA